MAATRFSCGRFPFVRIDWQGRTRARVARADRPALPSSFVCDCTRDCIASVKSLCSVEEKVSCHGLSRLVCTPLSIPIVPYAQYGAARQKLLLSAADQVVVVIYAVASIMMQGSQTSRRHFSRSSRNPVCHGILHICSCAHGDSQLP